MEYLAMNLHDIELLHRGELTVFVVPASMFSAKSGDVIGIKEPFRKIVAHITATATGEPEDNVEGVQYCFDLKRAWDGGTSPEDLTEYTVDYDESPRCSPAKRLPEYAVRRHRRVIYAEVKPLQSFTKSDIQAMKLDYASQGNPQIVMDAYEDIKDYELLYAWYKSRYRATLKATDNPDVVLLHLGLE